MLYAPNPAQANGAPERPGAGMVLSLDGSCQPVGSAAGYLDAGSQHARPQVLVKIVGRHLLGVVAVDHSVGRIGVGHWQYSHCEQQQGG